VTLCAELYVPAAGENVGVAAADAPEMVYVAVPTALVVKPLAVAIALIVSVELTVIGPLYTVEDVVGVLPSVV
jgi:hypothetical protein